MNRYLGDRFAAVRAETFPVNVMSGALLNTADLKSAYIYDGNSWAPINHFYVGSGIPGYTTGIILENQSNSGSFEDWGDLTAMSVSGDYGDLSAYTSASDWGDIFDAITPGTSIDVKLTEDRTTVSAIRFRRLSSGASNYDSTVEFWVTDSGVLLPRFWIQSGQYLPWFSGRMFLGSPSLPFSGVHTLKTILNQLQINDSVIPSTGNLLTSNSGQIYWSGFKLALLSGDTEDGIVTYNKEYPNVNVETGVKISGGRVELEQIRIANTTIPFDTSNVLSSSGTFLLWSGLPLALLSGNTNDGILTYNSAYPNANVETGVKISGSRVELGQVRIANTTNPFDVPNVLSASGGFLLWTGVRIPTMDFNGALTQRYDVNVTAATGSGINIRVPNGWQFGSGLDKLRVCVNGQLMTTNHPTTDWTYGDYSEIGTTGINFVFALPTGSRISFEIMV